jgi:four helix bundle protein
MGRFKDLAVWKRSKDLAVLVYKATEQGAVKRDFSLCDQLRRSAVSVPSNIAEGDERDSDKDSARFFAIAKGSLAELRTQLQIACEVGYLDEEIFLTLDRESEIISRMIGALIKSRLGNKPG